MELNRPWTEADLMALIATGEKESLTLDYKASASLDRTDKRKSELSKDVSAFPNSAGGVLIYGVLENGHVPVEIDDGLDPHAISKEWIEQVINSRIQRRIQGIRIDQVELTSHKPGRVAYVVTIPQSTFAPHQADDKRFYKRFNFESVPMEEYEVRDVSGRRDTPRVEPQLAVIPNESDFPTEPTGERRIELRFSVSNSSPTPAEHCLIKLYVDSALQVNQLPEELHALAEHHFTLDNGRVSRCLAYNCNYSGPAKLPVFGGLMFRIMDGNLMATAGVGQFLVGAEVFVPRASPTLRLWMLSTERGVIQLNALTTR
jgi:hypothetical protein